MKTHLILPLSLAAALLPISAGAAPLVLTNVPARVAAARLGAKYGIGIVLTENAGRPVNVSIEDEDGADDAGARLQTVNALANALRLDFTKTIVVSRSALDRAMSAGADAAAGAPADPDTTGAVDSAASVPFGATRLRTREAITLIANVDDAYAQIAGDIGGFVTLSRPTLTVAQAEKEIAKQTGTTWKAVYTLAPRERVASAVSPLIFFPDRQWEAEQRRQEQEAERQYAQEQAAAYQAYQQAAARQQALPQRDTRVTTQGAQGMNSQGMNNQGGSGSGYGYYGDPNQNGGYEANGGYGVDMNTSGNAGGNFPNHVVGN